MSKQAQTKLINAVWFLLCFLVVFSAHANADGTISNKLPPNYAHIASAAAILAAALKRQANLKINPDGTPAFLPYDQPRPSGPSNPTPTPTSRPTTGRSS